MGCLVDTTPPIVKDVTVSPAQVKAGESIAVYVDVTDDISGVASVAVWGLTPSGRYAFGTNIWAKTPEGIWHGTFAIPRYSEGGIWRLDVGAWDNVGNSKTYNGIATFEVIPPDVVDTTPPIVKDVTVSPAQVKAGESIAVYVDVTDDISGVASVAVWGLTPSGRYAFGTNIWAKTPEGIWHGTFAIPRYSEGGIWRLDVGAWDNVGNSKTYNAIATFEVIPTDVTPPEPPVLDQLATPTKTTPITVHGSTEAEAIVQVFVRGMLQGSIAANRSGRFSVPCINLAEGSNTITAKAIDIAGNVSEESEPITVVLDTTPPSPPTFNPLKPITNSTPIAVSGTAEPSSSIEIFVNNWLAGTVTVGSSGSFKALVNVYDQSNIITAIAQDATGNRSAPSAPLYITYEPLEKNIALNPSRIGYPNPNESDRGWGGGSDKWEIIDGKRTYPEWHHGLAFTGGKMGYAGESCGVRQATIDFGKPMAFHKVIVWHHGYEHIPRECRLEYWDGVEWREIHTERWVELAYAPPNGYVTTPDIHTFKPVVGSKVRYLFDNCGANMSGDSIEHGWLYEFEVFAPLPRIAYLPVSVIEGVGDVYTNKLGKQRIAVVKDLERINVKALSERTGIPLVKLYVIRRRAGLALSVKVDATAYKPLLDRRLDVIMRTPGEELSAITGQPSDAIDRLKDEISTLLLALDNDLVRNMLLADLSTQV